MRIAKIIAGIRAMYKPIVGKLDERGRRRWAAVESRSLGWGSRGTRSLADALCKKGYTVSHTKVGQLLKAQGFSLQSNRELEEVLIKPSKFHGD